MLRLFFSLLWQCLGESIEALVARCGGILYAYTAIAVGDSVAEIKWSRSMYSAGAFRTVMFDPRKDFCRSEGNDGENALLCLKEEFKSGGGTVRTTLYNQIGGRGFYGNEFAQGRGQLLTNSTFDLQVNQVRQVYGIAGRVDQQYLPWSLLKIGDARMADWLFTRMDVCAFAQLCGSSVLPSSSWVDAANTQIDATDLIYTGNNAVSAPTTLGDRIHRPNSESADEDLDNATTHKFSTSLVNKNLRIAREVVPLIRKARFAGRTGYVQFISPGQGQDLLADTTYTNLAQYLITGGKDPSSTLFFSGGYHPFKEVHFCETNLLPPGQDSSSAAAVANTRRSVFCGAQSLQGAFGVGYDKNRFFVTTELTDGKNRMERYWGSIYGLKTPFFDVNGAGNVDFARIVNPTYEPSL